MSSIPAPAPGPPTPGAPAHDDPLQPLLAALLGRAHRGADEVLRAADADAAATLAQARAQAEGVLAEARAQGKADAEAVLAGSRARAEREARAVLLAVQEQAYQQARLAVRDALRRLRDDPAHPRVVDALAARARAALGPGAQVRELATGGIEARAGDRRVEYSLDGLADDLVEQMGDAFTELWAP